jgi:HSP20 family protein
MKKKTSILSEIMQVEKEMEMIIEGFFEATKPVLTVWRPNLDIFENDREVIVEVELPGVEREDIKIFVYNDRLEVRGIKRGYSCPESSFHFILIEREYGYFQRIINLPRIFDPSASRAVLKNGILTISFKKISDQKEESPFEILIE